MYAEKGSFDFTPIGQAIKEVRESKKMTREQLAEIVDYSARHIQAIENEGQYPSFELFIQLITMFDISVDEYIFPDKKSNKSSTRRRIDTLLNKLNDTELFVLEATINGLCKDRVGGYPLVEQPISHTTVRTVQYTAVQ